jgi:hypothetical protein
MAHTRSAALLVSEGRGLSRQAARVEPAAASRRAQLVMVNGALTAASWKPSFR